MTADPALLRKAAQIIRDGGLSKGLFHTGDGKHCSVGALLEAAHGEGAWKHPVNPDDPAVAQEIRALGEVVVPGGINTMWIPIYNWNDDLHRTPEDVINAFEQAAQQLETAP